MNVDDKNNQQSQPQPPKNDGDQDGGQDKKQAADQKPEQKKKEAGSPIPQASPVAPKKDTQASPTKSDKDTQSAPAASKKDTQAAPTPQPSGASKQQNSDTNKKTKNDSGKEITPESFSGAGAAFSPPKSAGSKPTPNASPKPGSSSKKSSSKKAVPESAKKFKPKRKGKKLLFILLAILILAIGGAVTYYLVEMREEPVPTAPPSIPEAEEETPCTLEFSVTEPTNTPTPEPSPTPGAICTEDAVLTVESAGETSSIVEATASIGYTNVELRVYTKDGSFTPYRNPEVLIGETHQWTWTINTPISEIESVEFYVDVDPDAAQEDWGQSGELCGTFSPELSPTPSPTPEPTPEPNECGASGCVEDTDCTGDLICVSALDGSNYCSIAEFQNACIADPSVTTCCSEPTATPTATSTPTATPEPESTATSTPKPTDTEQVVDTSVDCNDSCTTNADCDNISHICYNGRCRLDINPEDEYCRTPQGETTVERIVEQPVAGPAEWLNFLRVGVGAIGAGLLLLLLL